MRGTALLLSLGVAWLSGAAHADELGDLGSRLAGLEKQAGDLERGIAVPAGPPMGDPTMIERRLVEAQVAYGVGRYGDASLILYDIVERFPKSRSFADAIFYLADSLFQKGDYFTARRYFHRIVDEAGAQNPHYQQTLERLIELSLRIQDNARVSDYLSRLAALPSAKESDSVPYVRGKYAYYSKDYDAALHDFDAVGPASKYYFQSRYFLGVAHVARGDLGAAAKILHDLTKVPTKNKDDETVVELAQLALGRIHYERDQPTDAIDHYLAVNRRSPRFDEALFEVAWTYVKAKQFDKALRALELLALANPKSAMLPDVRILEGNLRIRKAQTSAVARGNSVEEYAKAVAIFEDTRATYEKPHKEVAQILASHDDPRVFFAQITGHAGAALDIKVDLPDVVVAWIRELPEVQRVVGVTKNLDEIRHDLEETTNMIVRLERAVSSPSRVSLFPPLAEKRARAEKIGADLFRTRQEVAARERVIVGRHANTAEQKRLDELQQHRLDLMKRLAAVPNGNESHYERVRKARAQFVDLDKRAQQIDVYITSIEAQVVALDKYYHDTHNQNQAGTLAEADYNRQLAELRGLIGVLRKELEAIRGEILLASDETGISGELANEEEQLRQQLAEALAAEHSALALIARRMDSDDRQLIAAVEPIIAQAGRVEAIVARAEAKIDQIVEAQLTDVRATIVEEKGHVLEYKRALAAYDGENGNIGGDVIASSFDAVSKKFYEIGVRADVGLLDVSWSQKELSQQSAEHLRLDYAREKTQIDNELRSLQKEDEKAAAKDQPAADPEGGADAQP